MSELSEMSADEALSEEDLSVERLTFDELSMDDLSMADLSMADLSMDELAMDELSMDELAMDELAMDELTLAELSGDAKTVDLRAPFDFSLKVEVPSVRATDPSTQPLPPSLMSLVDAAPQRDEAVVAVESESTKPRRKGRFRRG